MQDIFDFLRSNDYFKNFDQISQYLLNNKYNFKDRYKFLSQRERKNNDNGKKEECSYKETKNYKIELDFSVWFSGFYDKYIEENNIDIYFPLHDERAFYRWIEDFDDNYGEKKMDLLEKIREDIEITKTEFDLVNDTASTSKHSSIYYSSENYIFYFLLPKENFEKFFQKYKSDIIINWNWFFSENKSSFSDIEVLEKYGDYLNLNYLIEYRKDWNLMLLKKFCHEISDAQEVLKLNIPWTSEIIDFVISNYTDSEGNLSYYELGTYIKLTELEFETKQIECIEWNEKNIEKYINFITESFSSFGVVKTKFRENFCKFKTNWSLAEVEKFESYIPWDVFCLTSHTIDDDFVQRFEKNIFPNKLLLNSNFIVNNSFIIKYIDKIELEAIVKSNFKIDIDIFVFLDKYYSNKPHTKFFDKLIENGNLSQDLIFYLKSKLNNVYRFEASSRRGSRADCDYYSWGYEYPYWLLLSKNPKIIFTDTVINNFYDKLCFEDLHNVSVKIKTVEKFLNYKNEHQIYHYDYYKKPYSHYETKKTSFDSILMKCYIEDLSRENFFEIEFLLYNKWFDKNSYNKNITKVLEI